MKGLEKYAPFRYNQVIWADFVQIQVDLSKNVAAVGDNSKREGIMEIQLQNLTKKFPNRNRKHPGDVIAVNEFNFTIPDGQLIGLLGPSGCGKSTTLNLICGLEKPTSGKIFFGGEDVTGVEPEHRGVGMVFQNYALYPHLTVRKNIMFPLENLKGKDRLSKEEMEKRVLDAAKMVSLEELLDRKPRELSGGQQQRVAIARAIAYNPEVVLFDEPTSALDPRLTGEVLDVMRKLADEGTTMVVVTHEMDFARKVANWVVYMEDGVIVEEAPSKKFFSHPKSEKTMAFLHMTSSDFVI